MSKAWISKRVGDYLSRKARHNGLFSRSYFKLQEINKKFYLIHKKATVLDLGCSPGGWSKFLAEKDCIITGVDLIRPQINDVNFIKEDLFTISSKLLGKYDVIVSDICPKISGQRNIDHANSIKIAEKVLELSTKVLKKGGNIIIKLFEGAFLNDVLDSYKEKFYKIIPYKCKTSPPKSTEIYICAFKKNK